MSGVKIFVIQLMFVVTMMLTHFYNTDRTVKADIQHIVYRA